MADVPVSYANADAHGVPAFEALDTYTQQTLLCSANPAQMETVRVLLADSLTLAKFSVVGLNAAGKLVLALDDQTTPANNIDPIGVLAHAAVSGATNTTKFGEVHLTGDYNIDADSPLVWDASFTTAALKTFAPVPGNPNLMFRSRTASGVSKA